MQKSRSEAVLLCVVGRGVRTAVDLNGLRQPMPVHRFLNLGDGVCQTAVFGVYDGGFAVVHGDFRTVRHGFLPDSERFTIQCACTDKKQAAGRHIADVQTCSQYAQQRNDQQECNAFFHRAVTSFAEAVSRYLHYSR